MLGRVIGMHPFRMCPRSSEVIAKCIAQFRLAEFWFARHRHEPIISIYAPADYLRNLNPPLAKCEKSSGGIGGQSPPFPTGTVPACSLGCIPALARFILSLTGRIFSTSQSVTFCNRLNSLPPHGGVSTLGSNLANRSRLSWDRAQRDQRQEQPPTPPRRNAGQDLLPRMYPIVPTAAASGQRHDQQ